MWEVLGFDGSLENATEMVVFGDAGDFEAVSVVESLLERSVKVSSISRHSTFGVSVPEPSSTVQAARDRVVGNPLLTHYTNAVLCGVDDTCAELEWIGSGRRLQLPADAVVYVGINQPNTDVTEALEETYQEEMHVIGDAQVPGRLREAISQAATLARTL